MTKKERVSAAITHQQGDTVPVCFTSHFPRKDAFGQAAVEAHLRYFAETDTDICKIMNENLVPSVGAIEQPTDWQKLLALKTEDSFLQDQIALAREIVHATDDSLFRVGTLHGICASMIHPIEAALGYEDSRDLLCRHLRADSAPVVQAMEHITELMCWLAQAYIEAGLDGVYYAALGAERQWLTQQEFSAFIEPYDRRILAAIHQAGGTPILHICKGNLDMECYAPYTEMDVVNWGIHENDFSLDAGRKLFPGKALLGGLDNRADAPLVSGDTQALREAIAAAMAEGGRGGYLLGADCTLPTDMPYARIRQAVDMAHGVTQ